MWKGLLSAAWYPAAVYLIFTYLKGMQKMSEEETVLERIFPGGGILLVLIRDAQKTDLAAITEIYNEAILTTTATFDTEPKSLGEQEHWFNAHNERYPLIVAEIQGKVVGWASLSKFSDRCAYARTAELSFYVKDGFRGMGIGKKLLESILLKGKEAGLHTVISKITSNNETSLHLHEEAGFEYIGVMREVGIKFGQMLDVTMMQLIYHEDK